MDLNRTALSEAGRRISVILLYVVRLLKCCASWVKETQAFTSGEALVSVLPAHNSKVKTTCTYTQSS